MPDTSTNRTPEGKPAVAGTEVSDTETPGLEKAERPSLSYKDLIIEAIETSPEKRLKLNEIYQV